MDYSELLLANDIRKEALQRIGQQQHGSLTDEALQTLMEHEVRAIMNGIRKTSAIMRAESNG